MQQNRSYLINNSSKPNARIREKIVGNIWLIKGGLLAWKLSREGGVINTVVDRGSSSDVSLVVYRREEGEEIMNTMQTDA